MNSNYEKYKELLSKMLTEKRYYHSLCVADEARRLAEKYGGDPEKCYLAGLLHDITKNIPPEEHLKIFTSFGIMLSDIEKKTRKLWHAITGEAYIKNVLGITDGELLDAVRYHTTAKADMSLTAVILYLADFTSLDRDYEDVEVIRELVNKSLEEAMVYALKFSISELTEEGKFIHPDTVDAYNDTLLFGGKKWTH
ncbi:MAG: bis(5'-nucleosyl)-tetraphosphatase (symmetrical) YqeK [Clostridia bacterium]|nr:bis(5'-nucleosyl)-tetraphosphatase (symmetrical) YqeK [Clostridia bacterium]